MPEQQFPTRFTQSTDYGFLVVELVSRAPRVWKATVWKHGNRITVARARHPLSAADSALDAARRHALMFGGRHVR